MLDILRDTIGQFKVVCKMHDHIFLVEYQPNGVRLDPRDINQSNLLDLWREHRDCIGQSARLTELVNRIPQHK